MYTMRPASVRRERRRTTTEHHFKTKIQHKCDSSLHASMQGSHLLSEARAADPLGGVHTTLADGRRTHAAPLGSATASKRICWAPASSSQVPTSAIDEST